MLVKEAMDGMIKECDILTILDKIEILLADHGHF